MTDHSPARRLDPAFYRRSDVVGIARALLGRYLVTAFDGQPTAGRIVETEAYRAPDDKACHAHCNRFTKRTQVMFEAGGIAYVYLCYGIHHLFNVVTGAEGQAHAVLIRAVEPADNVARMLQRRRLDQPQRRLCAGPGVLSQALGITTDANGASLTAPDSLIWIEDRGDCPSETAIASAPRIGIGYAEECAAWPWRFFIKENKWVSRRS